MTYTAHQRQADPTTSTSHCFVKAPAEGGVLLFSPHLEPSHTPTTTTSRPPARECGEVRVPARRGTSGSRPGRQLTPTLSLNTHHASSPGQLVPADCTGVRVVGGWNLAWGPPLSKKQLQTQGPRGLEKGGHRKRLSTRGRTGYVANYRTLRAGPTRRRGEAVGGQVKEPWRAWEQWTCELDPEA